MHRLPLIAALLLVLTPAREAPALAAHTRAFITCTDFSAGELSAVTLSNRAVAAGVSSVHTDAAVRWYGGKVYVVNRAGQDNIQILDPALNYAVVGNHSTGNGSNPYDIAFVSPTKAYVTRYNGTSVLIMNPTNGATLGVIDLSGFADADGIPEMARAIRVGRYLFVAVQRLDRNNFYAPTDSSAVVVVDTQTDQVVDVDAVNPGVQGILLAAQNPVTDFAFDRATTRLLIGCAGFYGATDGGIAAVDPVFFQSLGLAISEAALGGDVGDVEWMSPTRSFAIVSDASFNTVLVPWNDVTNTVSAPIYAPGGFSLSDCALNDLGEIYVCNSNLFGDYGLFVFRASDGVSLAGPLDTGLPPYNVCFDQADEVLAAPPASPAIAQLSAPWPNPARERVSMELALAAPGRVALDVVDAAGRRIAALADAELAAGVSRWSWDLRDANGAPAPAGLYWIRARGDGVLATARCVVIR